MRQVITVKKDDANTFAEDLRTRRAVEISFIVIGEIASHVPATVQQQ